nr:MAG TPA_asm: structural protein [Caudoviricetes sp.]
MKYLGTITDPKDLTTKEYVDDGVSGVQTSLTTHISDDSNPHKVTKTQVGLSNVDNIKQWSTNNHPTTLSGYGITDAATSSQLSALTTRVNTNEDNIAMAESDIEGLQGDVGTLKTDMTTVKGAVTTLQDTYVPNTRKINGKALSADITLTSADLGMGDTSNIIYGEDAVNIEATTPINADTLENHPASYFATASSVTNLASGIRAIYVGTADPASSLGADGDIYIKYNG